MTSADPELVELINRCKDKNAGPVFIFNGREVHIGDSRIVDFWLGYCTLANDNEKQRNFFLSETHSGAVPITIEGVIRFPKSYSHKVIITEEFIREVVRAYQLAISEKLVLTKKGKRINQLYAVYCQSEPFSNDTASAFRIQFPWCRIAPDAHKKMILPLVIDELKRRKSLDQLREHPKSDWDEILDQSSIGHSLPLYGSLRLPGVPRVIYQKVYQPGKNLVSDESDENMSDEEMSADGMSDEDIDKSLPEILEDKFPFNPRAHPLVTSGIITQDVFEDREDQTDQDNLDPYWLPLSLSLNYFSSPTLFIDEAKNNKNELELDFGEYDPKLSKELELAAHLLSLIKETRKKTPVYWRKIGMCLYTISEGDARGLHLWLDSCGGDKQKAEALYNEFAGNHRSLKTLAFYARIDSPSEYQAWHDEWAGEAMEVAMATLSDHAIADAFYRYYWLDFICFGQSSKRWYVFRNNKWNLTTDAIEVSTCMSTAFVKELIRFRARLTQRQAADERVPKKASRDKIEEHSLDDSINNVGKLKTKLEKNPYKTTLIKEACKHFHDERFDEIMNKDITFLFPFTNCVVEVDDETKKCIIRPGEPEDHITRNTGARLENYNINSPIVLELLEWLEQLFPDASLRHEFMKWLSSCIRGPNMDKKCTMLTGPSNGGKTTLFKTIALAMGPFYVTWEASDLLRATSPGAANPSVAKARYAKLVAIEEVGKNTIIAGELLKKITGNGKMNGRELFTQGENGWVANFKFAMAFNESKPKIDDADEAAMMRMMPFPMGSRWVWKVPGWSDTLSKGEKEKLITEAAKKRIFKADRFFDNKLPALARALAWYMVYYYPIYAEDGLKDHETIKGMVDSYWRELDDYGQFIDEVMEPITTTSGKPNLKAVVALDEVYNEFVTWYAQANSGFKQKPPKKSEFKKEMQKENHLGELDNEIDGWRGWAFKQGGLKKKRKLDKSPPKK